MACGWCASNRSRPLGCSEDLTFDKTDEKDAVLIARLTAQLRCYVPEPVDESWGRLRHLGARRAELVTAGVAQVQQVRDLLECVWPAALTTAAQPFRSRTWAAAIWVILDRDEGDLDCTRRLGWARFERAVRREITRRGGQKPCLRILRKLFAALSDPAGVIAHRRGALERAALVLEDWAMDRQRLAETERRMVTVLDELQLTTLVASIHGISAVGAAAILAESGDPHRFATARAMVKHAGLAPREKLSGTFIGRTKLTGQGRPRLRVAAWRAVWGSLQTNTVAHADSTHAGYQSKGAKGHHARPIDGQIAFFANAEDGVSNNIAFTVNPRRKGTPPTARRPGFAPPLVPRRH